MKTAHHAGLLNKPAHALLLGLALSFGTVSVSQAMSDLVSLAITPEWPTNTQPGSVTLYRITVTRAGAGVLDVSLSAANLPAGATASIDANALRFTGNSPETLTATLAITCTNVTATDECPFTVTGTSQRETLTTTNQTRAAGASARFRWEGPVLALDRLADGGLKLRGEGLTGGTYMIESAPSLNSADWTPLLPTTADGNGRFILLDSPSSRIGSRFYRAASTFGEP